MASDTCHIHTASVEVGNNSAAIVNKNFLIYLVTTVRVWFSTYTHPNLKTWVLHCYCQHIVFNVEKNIHQLLLYNFVCCTNILYANVNS